MDEPAAAFVAGRIGGCFAMPFIAFMARIITPSRRNVKFFFVVPKLCLANLNRGRRIRNREGRRRGEAELRGDAFPSRAWERQGRGEAALRKTHSQAALGNDRGAIGFRSLSSVSSTRGGGSFRSGIQSPTGADSSLSFPSSAWRIQSGEANPESGGLIREAKQSFAVTHSQAELGNDRRGAKRRFARRIPKRRLGTTGEGRSRASR